MSKVVYKYTCGRCNFSYFSETDRHLRVRAGEHISLSPLTFKKCKSSKESAVRDHLLFCDNDPSFEEFSVLAKASSKFSLEIKESLLIKRDTPNLNRNTASVELLYVTVDKYLLFYFITYNLLKPVQKNLKL